LKRTSLTAGQAIDDVDHRDAGGVELFYGGNQRLGVGRAEHPRFRLVAQHLIRQSGLLGDVF
jgi:hypothetical protein